MSILNRFKNREFSTFVKGNRVTLPVKITSFSIKTGENNNEITFDIPFSDKYDEGNLPFDAGSITKQGEVISLYIYGAGDKLEAIHYFQLFIVSISTRGGKKFFIYRGKDQLRNWAKGQHVWKKYNNIDNRDYYELTQSKYGFYWTDRDGTVKFQPANINSKDFNERMGLINARYAIIDIFYSPKREIRTKSGNINNYPELIFDSQVEKYLSTFILPSKQYQQTDVLTAILDILRTVNSKFTVYCYATGPELNKHIMLVTMIGMGKKFNAITNNNHKTTLETFVASNHSPDNGIISVIRDELSINTENQIDAIKYKGALRQYFVRNAWLIPAWDWWNDYDIIIRDSKTQQIIPPLIMNPQTREYIANSKYPPFMWNIKNSEAYRTIRSYSHVFEIDSAINQTGRIALIKAINQIWKELATQFKLPQNAQYIKSYIYNFACFDMEFFPTDPIHKYRFKRYIAIPSNRPDLINKITPQNGWEHPDLLRFKNIQDNLVTGKRNDINTQYVSSLLKRNDTSQLNIPILIEAQLPNYYNDKEESASTLSGFNLEWRQIDLSRLEAKDGFFWVSDWKTSSVYIDKSTVAIGPGHNTSQSEETEGTQPNDSSEDPRQPIFTTSVTKSGGITGLTVDEKPIWFRSKLRATFYYTKEETLRSKYFGGSSDPSAPNWYFDQIFQRPEYNDPWLAGIVTPSEIGINKSVDLTDSKTRYGILEDTTMLWQSPYDSSDPSSMISNGPDGTIGNWVYLNILQAGIVSSAEDASLFGRMNILLSWPHRDDRILLYNKAKLKLMENINPQFGGTIETLEMFSLGTNKMLHGYNLGLGYIGYRGYNIPLSGFTIQFPTCTTLLEFDTTPTIFGRSFEKEKITNIRTEEIIKKLQMNSETNSSNSVISGSEHVGENKSNTAYGGYIDPHKSNKPELFYKTIENYGKKALKIPNSIMNNAQKVVESMAKSVLSSDPTKREELLKKSLSVYPEMDSMEIKSDSRSGRISNEGE